MKRVLVVLMVLVAGVLGAVTRADEVTLEAVPPVGVKTIPEAGASDLAPKLS